MWWPRSIFQEVLNVCGCQGEWPEEQNHATIYQPWEERPACSPLLAKPLFSLPRRLLKQSEEWNCLITEAWICLINDSNSSTLHHPGITVGAHAVNIAFKLYFRAL